MPDSTSALHDLPATLAAVESVDLSAVDVARLDLDPTLQATMSKLGLGSIDPPRVSWQAPFADVRLTGVAGGNILAGAARWTETWRGVDLPDAEASLDLLERSGDALSDAGEAYAHDAAMTLSSLVLGAPHRGWDETRTSAAFALAFGVDAQRRALRSGWLGKLAYPVPAAPTLDFGRLLPFHEVIQRTCLAGVYKALNQLGAALSSAPREAVGAVIERLVPDRGCAGTAVELHGHGFGASPAGRWLVFPGQSGQIIVKVDPADWTDTLIRVTAPAGVGYGPVGFIDGNPEAGEFVGPAAAAFEGEVAHCLGPRAAAGMSALIAALNSFHTAAITPTQANLFRGGRPRVLSFTGNDTNPVLLRSSAELVLRWAVQNADSVTITKSGPRALPAVNGVLGEQGEQRFPPLKGAGPWTGAYRLTATNACGSVTADLPVELSHRTAWVLGGGGAKGAFEVGAMRCLVDAFSLSPDIISGASAGALNAAKMAEGTGGLADLETLWASLRGPADFFTIGAPLRSMLRNLGSEGLRLLDNVTLERMLGWHPTPSPTAQTIDVVATAFGPPMSQFIRVGYSAGYQPPVAAGIGVMFTVANVIVEALRIGMPFGKIVQALSALVQSRGLLRLDPVVARLRASLSPAALRAQGTRLRIAVTSLDTGLTEYVTESGQFASGGGANNLVEALTASASIPLAFPPVQLSDGRFYADGGLTDNIPIEGAMLAGADDVIAILASPGLSQENFARGALKEIGGRTFDLLFDSAERRQLNPFRGWGVPVRVIRPLHEVCSTFQIEAGLVQINRDYGYLRAYEEMQDDPVIRGFLRRNSSAWVLSRLRSWRDAFHANGATPPDEGLVEITHAPSPESLESVRTELQRQRDLMAGRLLQCAGDKKCLPPGIERSWQAWGPCDYVTLNLTPWDAMLSSVVRQVPAAAPPAPL